MKKSIIACLAVFGVTVACQNEELIIKNDSLSETLTDFSIQVTEDLGLTDVQSYKLTESLQQESKNENVPGFLWFVARHLQQNLPPQAKLELLQTMATIEQTLTLHGVCIPLGFEVNITNPLHPNPEMIVPLLMPDQEDSFREIVLKHQQISQNLISLRKGGLLSPAEFHGKMQSNYNSLMSTLIGGLLGDDQREQLKSVIDQLAAKREEYIVRSFQPMSVSLELNEETLQKTVALSVSAENMKNTLDQAFHSGGITFEMRMQAIRETCAAFHTELDVLFNDKQLEIIRIYRALSFRTRDLIACDVAGL